MCGIAGKLYFDGARSVAAAELRRMAETLQHRGPDGEGVWSRGNVGLAHRRLAVIDLREVARQPMSNERGTLWVSFNGEIYNFRELRRDLEGRGYRFRTNSDTEVILCAYEEWGRECLSRFRGMFALAIWDCAARSLFLARDRVGKKPLYYYPGRDRFLFASEIKALLTDPSVPREPDPGAVDHFLALQYIPGSRTIFEGIHKLKPAHWLEVRDGHIDTGCYWRLHYTPKTRMRMKDAVAELDCQFTEAVRLRMVSDVPLGAFLSGGIDSSAVVACMAREMGEPVKTFSVGFGDARFDERGFAREIARLYGTDHTELVVDPPVKDLLPRLVWHYDEPLGDSSAVPTYAISQLTRRHVTVVLSGDGGDENFAGYDWYKMDRLIQRVSLLPAGVRRSIAAMAQRCPDDWRRYAVVRKAVRLAEQLALPPARRYASWVEHFAPGARGALYTADFRAGLTGVATDEVFGDAFAAARADEWLDILLHADTSLYLPDDLLVKMDRASMAHALEVRSPFLDHVFMEFAAQLPSSFKLAWGKKKRILRKALRGTVPDAILDRPKMGFNVPLAEWFRADLAEMSRDVLLSERALQRGYFKPAGVRDLLVEHAAGVADHGKKLWDLLVLELWHRAFVDSDCDSISSAVSNRRFSPILEASS